MSLAQISIKRPIFMTSVILALCAAGIAGFLSLSVDLFPDVSIPVVTVQTTYQGAGPAEIENLVTRPIEERISTIAGIKRMTSRNLEGVSFIITEFESDVDARYAEQQVRDKVNVAQPLLPDEVDDPVITKYDPADSPILFITLAGDLGEAALYDVADQVIKPRLEQVKNVGAVDIMGGREREIHVLLDRKKLLARELSVTQVAAQIGASGENIPSGKVDRGDQELVFRGLGEFQTVQEVADTMVSLFGNEVATRVSDVGIVVDALEDETSRGFLDGKKVIFFQVLRQSGSNTIEVVDGVRKQMELLTKDLERMEGNLDLKIAIDGSTKIRDNVFDVYETLIIGIFLTVITVFYFLGSARSTMITALSLPISLIGTFTLLYAAGFSINLVTLLALVLAIGLLIDDAIVVIENIYRRMELGESSGVAAERGTKEIQMAVIAITLVIMAVFVPVALMSGTIGQFLKQFGLTVAFSMAISIFVAFTVMPMLTAYFGGEGGHAIDHSKPPRGIWGNTIGRTVRWFDKFQTWLENVYEKIVTWTLKHTLTTIVGTFLIFMASMYTATHVPFEFIPDDDSGEIMLTLELPLGTNIDKTSNVAHEVDKVIKQNKEVDFTFYFAGGQFGEMNKATFIIKLFTERDIRTIDFRDRLRDQLVDYKDFNPIVKPFDIAGAGGDQQPVTLNLVSANPEALSAAADKVLEKMRNDKRLKDVDSNYRMGKPEFQIRLKPGAAKEYGINTKTMGGELRSQVEGATPAKFREKGREYDVRVRMQDDQRDLKELFGEIYIPNINNKLVRLNDVAIGEDISGLASIERQDRGRYIQLTAGLAPGVGLSDVITDIVSFMNEGEGKLPSDVRYTFAGDAENMQDLAVNTVIVLLSAIIVIYLILASLYESFITPITIMLSLPLALSGAFLAIFITGKTMNFFAILGLFMLIGVSGKNGILLVDFAKQMMDEGMERGQALVQAGKTRLRPILMTSFALAAGLLPVAIGLNPASRTRTSMGVGIIGGILLSTVLTLIVVPAIFVYVDRFKVWANNWGSRFVTKKD